MKLQDRFFSEGQTYLGPRENPITETHYDVWGWDRLRMVKVKGTAKLFPPDEDKFTQLRSTTMDFLLQSRSIRKRMILFLLHIFPSRSLDRSPIAVQSSTLHFGSSIGLDQVLISHHMNEFGIPQRVAFKFNPFEKPLRLQMAWDELNLLKSLPPHPNIVPFDRVVLEDMESRVIGFTTKYIPGGTLDNTKVPFGFEWMKQLTQLVDFLNLELGIMHQDIAPRNLLIDPDTHKILLFDFDWAAHGKKRLLNGRDDVTNIIFTLYELITNDTHFTSIPHRSRNMDIVQSMQQWAYNRELDSDVSTFRNFLNEWVATRKSDGDMERYLNAPNRLTWPDLPTAPDYNVPFELGKTLDGEPIWKTGPRFRRTAMEMGQYCFHWERPPQRGLLKNAKNSMY
ncbi:hypothetical protein FE257_010478 [Aspergillus nanangensis]|uniref:EKC/KEOPS complex subunit BUD32 n=1 Tax=Aspergillus nanangensis TaxID=2582783 RepID=A0AAD4CIJ9_ASPNN|nr:hypothetical protein FE257_010478 [Aspergillus nanangensis]